MLYALQLLIGAQKMKSADSESHKLLIGFCLQALEMSRYRLSFAVNDLELDWLEKMEMFISDFLVTAQIEDTEDAVAMYIHAMKTVGSKFYRGRYPLVMIDKLCSIMSKRLYESLGRDLVNICAEILLNLSSCLHRHCQMPGAVLS